MKSSFTELERAAWGGFIVTQSRLFGLIEEDLRRRFGITHAEFEVLLRLTFAEGGRARIQDLAARSLLSRSGTSRAVERLARAGHLERQGAEEDGRGAYAVLTRQGRRHFLAAAREHVQLVRREFLSRLSGEAQAMLADLWRRLAERSQDGAAPDRPRPVLPAPRLRGRPSGPRKANGPANRRQAVR